MDKDGHVNIGINTECSSEMEMCWLLTAYDAESHITSLYTELHN